MKNSVLSPVKTGDLGSPASGVRITLFGKTKEKAAEKFKKMSACFGDITSKPTYTDIGGETRWQVQWNQVWRGHDSKEEGKTRQKNFGKTEFWAGGRKTKS